MKNLRSQSGIAMITVLWVIVFLTVITSAIVQQTRSSLHITKNQIDSLKLRQLAESVILLSVAERINFPSKQNNSIVKNIFDNSFENIQVNLIVSDESGKVDLNTASFPLLLGLMSAVGADLKQADKIANAILDWRDEDNSIRVNGAETEEYFAAGYPYGSKNANFESIDELLLIYGMNEKLFSALKPHVTVYSLNQGINLAAASELVKIAIGYENTDEDSKALDNDKFLENQDEEFDDFDALVERNTYTYKVSVSNEKGMRQEMSATIRHERSNKYEPFTVLNWN